MDERLYPTNPAPQPLPQSAAEMASELAALERDASDAEAKLQAAASTRVLRLERIEQERTRDRTLLAEALTGNDELAGFDAITELRRDVVNLDMTDAESRAASVGRSLKDYARRVVVSTEDHESNLTDDERESAAQQVPLVEAEVGNYPMPKLIERVRSAIQANDRPSMHALTIMIPKRLEGESDTEESQELGTLVGRMRTSLHADKKSALHLRATKAAALGDRLGYQSGERSREGQRFSFQADNELDVREIRASSEML